VAAVPSIGRAVRVEGASAPEADLTRALYEQYANQIFRYCLHQLGSREEAEDAVQSTFLNAFRGIKRGVVPEIESAWLFAIAHNVCLSRRRTSWRRGRIESPTDFDIVEELAPAPSRRADELMGLQDVLEQMPENQRRAILLREWQGLSYREIADELELSQAAVETLIFRARRSLAAGLEEPPAAKRRIVRGADIGNILAGLKALLLGGGAAAKVAATVAVVSAGTVVAAAPVQQHRPHSRPAPAAPARASVRSAPSGPAATTAGSAAASPAKTTRAPAHALRPRPQVAKRITGQTGASSVPAPVSQTPAPVDAAPAAPVSAPPASEPPADAPRSEPDHTAAPTPAPADRTTSDKSKSEAPSTGRSGDTKKDTSHGRGGTSGSSGSDESTTRGDSQGASESPRAGDNTAKSDKSSKGSDSAQQNGAVSTGRATTLPVVTTPVTLSMPPSIQTTADQPASDRWGNQSSGDKRTITPVPASPTVTVSAPTPASSSGASTGNGGSEGTSANGGDSRRSASVTLPPAVIAPQTTSTLPSLTLSKDSPAPSKDSPAPSKDKSKGGGDKTEGHGDH
jgi:RNA polymerase sigma factor (sigma-70 family)